MIVDYAGDDDGGRPLFDVILSFPERQTFDSRPSDKMRAALDAFYGPAFPDDLTNSQAHALFAYRDYGRQCAARLFDRRGGAAQEVLARFIAAFVGSDDAVSGDVLAWSDRLYRAGTDSASIGRSKRFADVRTFCEETLAYLEAAGARLDLLDGNVIPSRL